jgi:hypothetical protein
VTPATWLGALRGNERRLSPFAFVGSHRRRNTTFTARE